MKLYGFGPTRSLRALWGLRELGADFEFVPVNLLAGRNRRPDFLRLNPAGKLPVLVDGDFVLTESAAIVLYLAEKYRAAGFLPAYPKARAQVYRWIMFAVTELEQPLWRITKTPSSTRRTSDCPPTLPLPGKSSWPWLRCWIATWRVGEPMVGDCITAADCVTAYLMDWAN